MSTDFSENTLVEQPAISLFEELGYETANWFFEKTGTKDSTLGRETTEDVILVPKLRSALKRLNPNLDGEAINLAIEELTRDRSAMSLVQANRVVYKLLKDGVKVDFQNDEGEATYAISNQWGTRTMEAVEKMIARCPNQNIHCEPMA